MPPGWLILAAVLLPAWAAACAWIVRNPRGDVETGLLWHPLRGLVGLLHGLRVEGRENIPPGRTPGPLLVVANHTAGVDPLLVQAACPFEIRWIMSSEMRLPVGEPFWRWARIIFTAAEPGHGGAAREAMRHLQAGGVLGIFPEGGLERPARRILPFRPGVGMLIKRLGVPVLPAVIDGTPEVEHAWASLWTPSRARVRFLPVVDYSATRLRPGEIIADLRGRYLDATGWPQAPAAD